MLILPTIPPKPKPTTPADFSLGRNGRAVTEESLAKYELAELEQKVAKRIREDIIDEHSIRFSLFLLVLCIVVAIINGNWKIAGGIAFYAIILSIALGPIIWGLLAFIISPISRLLIPNKKHIDIKQYAPEIEYGEKQALYEAKLHSYTRAIGEIAKITGKPLQEIENAYLAKELNWVTYARLDCFDAYQNWIGSFHKYLDEQEARKSAEFWQSLSGYDFEKEVCRHFSNLGYTAKQTPLSNDGGVDIILTKEGEITYVQCKHHNSPCGISVARELLGVMSAKGVKKGILATIKGVNHNCMRFCVENGIRVMRIEDFIDRQPRNDTLIDLEILREEYYHGSVGYKLGGIQILPSQFCDINAAKEYAKANRSSTQYAAIIPQHPTRGETIYGVIMGSYTRITELAKAGFCGITINSET